jgi:FkbM family methyltransferase
MFVERLVATVGHAIERKLLQPRRRKSWNARSNPFVHTTLRGLRFKLHPRQFIDTFIFVEGIYERRFLDIMRIYFRKSPGKVSLDIGSNIGNHAIYLHDCFQSIHCFDPNPVVVQRLRDNISLNPIGNIHVHAVGLSDRTDALEFEIDRFDLGSSHFVEKAAEGTISLPVVIGDEYVENLKLSKIDFIKIDVEGHEPHVFAGLARTIARHRPIVAFEHHGAKVDIRQFDVIAATMPDYIFTEFKYISHDASGLAKLLWHLTTKGPRLQKFERPDARSYENIIAFPDSATLDRFLQLTS